MASLPVYNRDGKEVGTYEFDLDEIAAGVNRQLLHDAVVMYQTNARQGTVRTKSRGEVAGSTKKLYRQKGTGHARAGSKRTNIRRGGGHAFAKRNVDYGYRMPKKAVRLATRMAVRSKFDDDQVTILDDLSLDAIGTRQVAAAVKALGLQSTSCLLAIDGHDPVIWKSARNIENLWVAPVAELNAYNVLHQRQFVVTRAALDRLRGAAEPVEA